MRKIIQLLAMSFLAVMIIFSSISIKASASTAGKTAAPCNPNATAEAKNLFNYLEGVCGSSKFIVGAFDQYVSTGNPNGENYDGIKNCYGVSPGLYSTHYPYYGNGFSYKAENTAAYNHYKDGAVILMHNDAEWTGKLYTKAREQGVSGDIMIQCDSTNPNRNMTVYNEYFSYLKQWGDCLEDLESRGVKCYLFRPFVEMNSDANKATFCTTQEGLDAFKRVWAQLYDYFYNVRKLNGCLLTYAPAGGGVNYPDYFPGEQYVDIMSCSTYSSAENKGAISPGIVTMYNWLSSFGKPVGFSELGCRHGFPEVAQSDPPGDWYRTLQSILAYCPNLAYVNTFSGCYTLLPPDHALNAIGNLNGGLFLNSPYAITLKDIPDFSKEISPPGVARLFKEKGFAGSYYGFAEGTYSKSDISAMGIDPSEITSMNLNNGYKVTFYSQDNCTGTSWTYISNLFDVSTTQTNNKIASMEVSKIEDYKNVNFENPIYASGNQDDSWKANDDMPSIWTDQTSSPSWLVVDLKGTYVINRWVVKNAEVCTNQKLYNTVDYQLQTSMDGVHWTAVDTVKGNTSAITDRKIPQVTACLLRLYVTKPNNVSLDSDKNKTTIAEFAAYGIKTGESNAHFVPTLSNSVVLSSDSNAKSTIDTSSSTSSNEAAITPQTKIKKPKTNNTTDNGTNWTLYIILGIVAFILIAAIATLIYFKKFRKVKKVNEVDKGQKE